MVISQPTDPGGLYATVVLTRPTGPTETLLLSLRGANGTVQVTGLRVS